MEAKLNKDGSISFEIKSRADFDLLKPVASEKTEVCSDVKTPKEQKAPKQSHKIVKKYRTWWSRSEVNFLKENPNKSVKWIGRKLGRKTNAVVQKRVKLRRIVVVN